MGLNYVQEKMMDYFEQQRFLLLERAYLDPPEPPDRDEEEEWYIRENLSLEK